MSSHRGLVKGAGLGPRSKETIDRCWNDLASKLNAHFGAKKNGQRWKRYWADLKHKMKTRIASKRRDMSRTGGGSPGENSQDLTSTETKVLSILGEGAVFGDSQHRVPVFLGSTSAGHKFTSIPSAIPSTSAVIEDIEISPHSDSQEHPPSGTKQKPRPTNVSATTEQTNQSAASEPVAEAPKPMGSSSAAEARQGSSTRFRNLRLDDSPVSSRRPKRRRVVMSSETDTSWVVDLERRRVEAEEKLASAALIAAEASRTAADASHIIARASLIQAETTRATADAMRLLAEVLERSFNRNNPQ